MDVATATGITTVALGTGAPSTDAIYVTTDASRRFQSIEGFGAAMTESSAVNLARLSPPVRERVMRDLFDTQRGMGFSYLRVPLGSSDFAESTYSYADVRGPAHDPLKHFSLERDQRAVIPMLQEARRVNPQLKVMITPWQPPGWMCVRDNGVRTLPRESYAVYADYLIRTLEAYARLSPPIHVDALTPQNEPYFYTPEYPSLRLDAAQQTELIRDYLGPKLDAYNRSSGRPAVKLLSHDHNWDLTSDALEVLNGAGSFIDAIAYHGYGGEPRDHLVNIAPSYPKLPVYFTEISSFYGSSSPADNLMWDARNTLIGPLCAGARVSLKWNIALDAKNGPVNGGVGTLRGLLKVDGDTVVPQQEYFGYGVVSRNVKQGAVRIGVQTSAPLDCAAFLNPDGSNVLLTYNPTDKPLVVALENGARATIGTKSLVAITIRTLQPSSC